MSILATILNTLVVILAVLLIALILVQPTKSGGGFGSAFGGLGESVFGAQAMSHLSKLTVWCISIFFVLTLASAIVASRVHPSENGSSIVNKMETAGAAGTETAGAGTETAGAAGTETAGAAVVVKDNAASADESAETKDSASETEEKKPVTETAPGTGI